MKTKMSGIKDIVMEEVNEGLIAGANVLVMKENEIIYQDSFGYANIAAKKPMKLDTIVRLFSMTKPITAVATLILKDRGILKLDDPVSKYLNGFSNQMVDEKDKLVKAHRTVTIYDLLTMTAGVLYPEGGCIAGEKIGEVFQNYINEVHENRACSTVEFCNRLGKAPLGYQPGSKWKYGSCADVLGGVIEVASGMKFSEFLKKEIFEPLGMKDTGFYVTADKLERFSEVYEYNNEKHQLMLYRGDNLAMMNFDQEPQFESGGAGLTSTILDYAKFAKMLVNEGSYQGKQIVSKESMEEMTRNHLTKEQKIEFNWEFLKGFGYGYLVRVLEDTNLSGRKSSVGTYGWDGWTGPYIGVDPVKKITVLYMIQKVNSGTTKTTVRIHDYVYECLS